ncbi:MAG: hypothetical protein IKM97_00255 [Clostridia bacterium]|nr:hypothetical protein [Clostridia bacterium]
MATTKIGAVKNSLSRVVNYAENPEKTIFSDLKQVLKYAENDDKTIADNGEKSMYVTGVNCNRETAFEEMVQVQKRFWRQKNIKEENLIMDMMSTSREMLWQKEFIVEDKYKGIYDLLI